MTYWDISYKNRDLGYKFRDLGYKNRDLGYKNRDLGYKNRDRISHFEFVSHLKTLVCRQQEISRNTRTECANGAARKLSDG
jgi:hypothetical protein